MNNLPPPDQNPSKLGLDELIGIIVAFAAIGTVLIVTLGQKNKGFDLRRLIASPTPDRTTQVEPAAIPTTPLPEATPSPPATAIAPVTSPTPSAPLPAKEANSGSRAIILAPAPSVPMAKTTTVTPTTSPVATVNFVDIKEDFWARPYIQALVSRQIMTGFPDGTFRPNSSINRAEFSALVKKAFEQKPTLQASNFKDVSPKFWAWSAIQESTKTGFLRGYPRNTFQPEQPIPKVQVLVALASGLGLKNTKAPSEILQTYQDANQIPKYATQKVSAATETGLVVNYPEPKSLNPNKNATRAEVAALIYQALVQTGKAEAMPSKYIVKP
ncbi:MAG TPA: S-layer protein [Cyanobacteria bacterium UBA8803]|nr:S-layer protein [Cyanobacteria bacterium UBA9273]HBL60711.1 S-layer protein [Cyanobacteria bacterium UBA8803]